MSFLGYLNVSLQRKCETVEVTHERTNEVQRARKHTLIQEYKMFRMQKGETIVEVQKQVYSHSKSSYKSWENFC